MNKKTVTDTLLGIAIGDAFGVGIEFKDRNWIRDNIDFTRFVEGRIGECAKNHVSGYYSDDTEHTIGLVKALMDPRPFSEELLLEYWKNEYESDKQRKGFGRQGHGSILEWYEGKKTIEEVKDAQRNRIHPGNAPPMRAVMIGFLDTTKIDRYALINADVTHPHPEARAASILIAHASEYIIIKQQDSDRVIKYCQNFVDDVKTINLLKDVDKLSSPKDLLDEDWKNLCGEQPIPFFSKKGIIINGLPCDSLRTAISSLYVLKHSKDAFDGLKTSIRFGGDVDSLAAICTGILGGRYGLETIPGFMLEETEGVDYIKDLSEKFYDFLNNSEEI